MRLSPLNRSLLTLVGSLIALDASLIAAPPVRANHNRVDIYATYGGCALPDSGSMTNQHGGCYDSDLNIAWAVSGLLQYDSYFTWDYATTTFCPNLRQGGYADWRLPTRAELRSLWGAAGSGAKWEWLHLREPTVMRRWSSEKYRGHRTHWVSVLSPGHEFGVKNSSFVDALCVRTVTAN